MSISYLRKSGFFKRLLVACIIFIFFFSFYYLLVTSKIILFTTDSFDIDFGSAFFILFIFVSVPGLYSSLKLDFIKTIPLKAILLPMVLSPIIKTIITFSLCTYFILVFNDARYLSPDPRIEIFGEYSWSFIILCCLMPAVFEEIMFRFFTLQVLQILLKSLREFFGSWPLSILKLDALICFIYNQLYVKRSKIAVFFWIIITSYLFSSVHNTNHISHFLCGAFFAFVYIKYGLLSSMVAHFISNYSYPLITQMLNLIY